MDMKKCSRCKELKPVSDFNLNRTKADGYGSECRECANQYWYESTGYESDRYYGFVYAIKHPVHSEWIKVGRTGNPESRVRNLNLATPFRDYQIDYTEEFKNRQWAEGLVHDKLVELGIEKRYEWFYTDLETIKKVMDEVKHEEASIGHRDEQHTQYDLVLSDSGC